MWADALSFVRQAHWGMPTYQAFPCRWSSMHVNLLYHGIMPEVLTDFIQKKKTELELEPCVSFPAVK